MSSPVIPLDPVEVENLPPEDVDACPSCKGVGAIWPASNDPQDIRDCSTCGGTGVMPEPYGVAS
jgi:DnaJ-class molecular chaperone